MIQLPKRSVTRFFIPLIDVLLLLFCIFLLMPLVKATGEGTGSAANPAALEERIRQLEQELAQLRKAGAEAPQQLREELERLRQERVKSLQERLVVRVLQIDPETGGLFYLDPERVLVRTQAEARELIDRDRRTLAEGGRELYYLILYPRDRTSRFPQRGQREQYDHWFEGVAHGWDIPGAAPTRRNEP